MVGEVGLSSATQNWVRTGNYRSHLPFRGSWLVKSDCVVLPRTANHRSHRPVGGRGSWLVKSDCLVLPTTGGGWLVKLDYIAPPRTGRHRSHRPLAGSCLVKSDCMELPDIFNDRPCSGPATSYCAFVTSTFASAGPAIPCIGHHICKHRPHLAEP